MADQHTDSVDGILEQLLSRPEAEWQGAIEGMRADRPDIADELLRRFDVLRESGLVSTPTEGEAAPLPGQFGEFMPVRLLGEGGMGIVYEARQGSLARTVALKVIRPGHLLFQGARERFRREIDAVARLSHPGIVSVVTVGEERETPWFAMELLRGAGLDHVLRGLEGRRVEAVAGRDLLRLVVERAGVAASLRPDLLFEGAWWEVCVGIGIRIADALAHAHGNGVVHRDVKPSNIVVTPEGRVVLLDFGLATATEVDRMTRPGTELGSLPYLAPEVLRGAEADSRSDQYALALTLYELLGLWHPFLAAHRDTTRARIVAGAAPSIRRRNRHLPRDLAIVLGKAMDPDPSLRYGSISAFAADLHAVRRKLPISARPTPSPRRLWRWCQRHPALATGLVLGFGFAIGTPTAVAIGIAAERDRAVAAEHEEQLRAYEANIAAANAALQAHDATEARRRLDACAATQRGFEWRLLAASLDGSLGELSGCTGRVTAVALADDAQFVAAIDEHGAVEMWEPERDLTPRRLANMPDAIELLAFVAGDSGLLAVAADGRAFVFDTKTGALTAERAPSSALERFCLSTDGRDLWSATGDWRVTALDPATLATRKVVELERKGNAPLDGFAVGDDLLLAKDVGNLRAWNLTNGRSIATATVVGAKTYRVVIAVSAVAGVTDSHRIFVGSTALTPLRCLDSAESGADKILVDPSGEFLFGLTTDGTLRTYRISDGSRLSTLLGAWGPGPFGLARRRLVLATGSDHGTVKLWSPFGGRDRQQLSGENGSITQLAVAHDGVLLSASRSAAVVAWDPETGEPLLRFGAFPHWVNTLAVAPDATSFYASFHGTIAHFRMGDPKALWKMESGANWISSLATSPTNDLLLASTIDHGLVVVDAATRRVRQASTGRDADLLCCAFSADGRTLFAGGETGRIVRQSIDDRDPPVELGHAEGPVRAMICVDDGARLYLAEGARLRARDAVTGAVVWDSPCSSPAHCVAGLHDGSRLVTGHADGSLVVWASGTGRPLLTVALATTVIHAVVADPDGHWIAAGGDDRSIAILHAEHEPMGVAEALHRADVRRALLVTLSLRRSLVAHDDVMAAISARNDFDPVLREKMCSYEAICSSPSWEEMFHAFEVAASPGQDPDRYRQALQIALATMTWPDEVIGFAAAALAHERLGAHEHALRISSDGLRSKGAALHDMEPALRAARVLALIALNRRGEAETERDRMMQIAVPLTPDPISRSLQVEVEAALRR